MHIGTTDRPAVTSQLAQLNLVTGLGGHHRTALLATLAQDNSITPRMRLGGVDVELHLSGPARAAVLLDFESLAEEIARRVASRATGGPAATVRIFEQRLELAHRRHEIEKEQRRGVAEQVRAERQHVDTFAAMALDDARQVLAGIEMSLGITPGGASVVDFTHLDERRAGLDQRIAHIDTELARLGFGDTARLLDASLAVRAVIGENSLPSDEAVELANELVEAQLRIAAIEDAISEELGVTSDALTARIDEAQRMVNSISGQLGGSRVAPGDAADLEQAHDAVLTLENRIAARFAPRGARKELDEARAREQEVLDRIGFPTWTAYIMETTNYGSSQDARRRLAEAIADQDSALAAWSDYLRRLDAEPGFRELLDRLGRIADAAEPLVGDVDDLELALRSYRLELGTQHTGEVDAAVRALRDALVTCRAVAPDDNSDPGRLLGIADVWLAGLTTQRDARAGLEGERGRLQMEIASIDRLLHQATNVGSAAVADIRLRESRRELATAASRLDRHRLAIARIADMTAQLTKLDVDLEQIDDEIRSLGDLLAVTAGGSAGRKRETSASDALEAAARLSGVESQHLAAQPAVLIASRDDDPVVVAATLAALAPITQVLVLGDNLDLAERVGALGGLVVASVAALASL